MGGILDVFSKKVPQEKKRQEQIKLQKEAFKYLGKKLEIKGLDSAYDEEKLQKGSYANLTSLIRKLENNTKKSKKEQQALDILRIEKAYRNHLEMVDKRIANLQSLYGKTFCDELRKATHSYFHQVKLKAYEDLMVGKQPPIMNEQEVISEFNNTFKQFIMGVHHYDKSAVPQHLENKINEVTLAEAQIQQQLAELERKKNANMSVFGDKIQNRKEGATILIAGHLKLAQDGIETAKKHMASNLEVMTQARTEIDRLKKEGKFKHRKEIAKQEKIIKTCKKNNEEHVKIISNYEAQAKELEAELRGGKTYAGKDAKEWRADPLLKSVYQEQQKFLDSYINEREKLMQQARHLNSQKAILMSASGGPYVPPTPQAESSKVAELYAGIRDLLHFIKENGIALVVSDEQAKWVEQRIDLYLKSEHKDYYLAHRDDVAYDVITQLAQTNGVDTREICEKISSAARKPTAAAEKLITTELLQQLDSKKSLRFE